MQRLSFPTEFKAAEAETGRVKGYASIANELDLGGHRVAPGAFCDIKANAQGKIPFLWGHDDAIPIGVASVNQDTKGLAFDAQLVLEDPAARTALAHFKAGSVSGVSIGYDVIGGRGEGFDYLPGGEMLLKKIRLWEISAVTFPMCQGARIESVKSKPETIGELEDLLRAGGYSKSETKRLLQHGWRGVSDADDNVRIAEGLIEQLKSFNGILRGTNS